MVALLPLAWRDDPALTPEEAAFLDARWAEACAAVASAPRDWAAWAREELAFGSVGRWLAASRGWELAGDAATRGGWDEVRTASDRVALGQYFTPGPLARLAARIAGVGREEAAWPDPTVLDPACGAGSMLLAAAEARDEAGWTPAATLAALEGWDRDPVAAWLCRAGLVGWALSRARGRVPGPLRVAAPVDALLEDGAPGALLARSQPYAQGVGLVLSNPPYLEAKRMGAAQPGLREQLRRDFPALTGAVDLYLAFCWRALEQVDPGGAACLVLPNKVLQGRYAAAFRRRLAPGGDAAPAHLVDLSRLQPRPFPGTSVYPVVLHAVRGEREKMRARRVVRTDDLDADAWIEVDRAALASVGGEQPMFAPFEETWSDLAPLFRLPRLGSVARIVSTCSFHATGLRERFVTPERPDAHAHPYLGGPSRARRAEVGSFQTSWAGWWIRYDAEELAKTHSNPLPDLARTFLRPKAILCQHATRVRAVADFEGRWVTKDVYPVAWPVDAAWSLEALVAVLSSTVFTALYNTVYQGIVVGGETYHYLPAFLATVPVPERLDGVEELVRGLHGRPDPDLWRALDQRVASAYGVDERARRCMVEVHLRRVGAEAPAD